MAETSKNKIYYNDNEDSIADVLEDMKKLAESTDNAIEKAKYNDTELKNKNTAQDEEIAQLKERDTTQDSLIEQLQTKVVNLEAENTSLKNQIPSGEATGNPIHLTDSSDLECEIAVVGNSEQETRSGKNKFKVENKTANGITETINADGSITVKGTATATFNFDFSSPYVVESGTYFAWFERIGGSLPAAIFSWNHTENTILISGINENGVALTINENTKIGWSITITNGSTINFTIKPQMETGNAKTDYEQYGASPSPDYPSEIVTVGQNGSVEIKVDNGLETTDTNYQSYTKVLPVQEEMLDEDYISDKEYHNWEKIESYNGEEITTDFKSTTGELTTGATVYYKLATPKELELTEEQSAILNSFYTYKGITNISVDGIATLKVNYKKDLETIINKLSATSVAE